MKGYGPLEKMIDTAQATMKLMMTTDYDDCDEWVTDDGLTGGDENIKFDI